MDVLKKVPVREQAPDVRNKNFEEVCLGYNRKMDLRTQKVSRRKQQKVLMIPR